MVTSIFAIHARYWGKDLNPSIVAISSGSIPRRSSQVITLFLAPGTGGRIHTKVLELYFPRYSLIALASLLIFSERENGMGKDLYKRACFCKVLIIQIGNDHSRRIKTNPRSHSQLGAFVVLLSGGHTYFLSSHRGHRLHRY